MGAPYNNIANPMSNGNSAIWPGNGLETSVERVITISNMEKACVESTIPSHLNIVFLLFILCNSFLFVKTIA